MSTQQAVDAQKPKHVVASERFVDFFQEMVPLNIDHYHEVAMYKDHIQLRPDYDQYIELDKIGLLACFTVRVDGELVGYNIFFVRNHIHYIDNKFACNDVLFLKPEYRGGVVAKDLMDFSEEFLRAIGCDVMSMHMKNYKPFKTLMKACEFDESETLYTKYIRKA